MLISVNICLYNSTKYIQETLDSVFAQTYQDFEVIAIDDGSTDGTYEFIKERYNDPRLKLYRQKNHGLAYSRNRCAELSHGEYLAFLDHDDVWLPEKLDKQVKAIGKVNNSPSLVVCDFQFIDAIGTLQNVHSVKRGITLTDNFFETILNARSCIIGLSGTMLLKQLWDCGTARFENNYKMSEEYDVWLKASMERPSYAYVPEVLYYYRVHGENTILKFPELLYLEPINILQNLLIRANDKHHRIIKLNIATFYLKYGYYCYENCIYKAPKAMLGAFKYNKTDIHIWWGVVKSILLYIMKLSQTLKNI